MKAVMKIDGSLYGLSVPFLKAGTVVELEPLVAAPGYDPSTEYAYATTPEGMHFVVRFDEVKIIEE